MYLRSEIILPISSKWNSYSAANVDFISALLGKAFQHHTDRLYMSICFRCFVLILHILSDKFFMQNCLFSFRGQNFKIQILLS